jgi:hypothetical protein
LLLVKGESDRNSQGIKEKEGEKKMKHKTEKWGEFYIYRGWLIKKWDNNYLNDPDIRGVQWNTYKNLAAYHSGGSTDIARTLRDAKMYIDICFNRYARFSERAK